MTPLELMNHKPLATYACDGVNNFEVFSLLKGCDFDHIPEVAAPPSANDFWWYESIAGLTSNLMINVYADDTVNHYADVTGVLYYTRIPVLVFRHAGRDSVGEFDNWIIQYTRYQLMIDHLTIKLKSLESNTRRVYSVDTDIPQLILP